ncbi:hypothetical protein AVEN_259653-1 [Araneus ventricosus]|uniref:Uncharacterized protein n=1 Tax=Araneus ventricosus TaxID=182803 RepID=A0A4Y2BSR3_ARAVE|nr:hypothetical protein AVEN_100513-1 [Araneus ventricosus]GBL95252.1 hypothetical protein AVEN_259653-1 [Araneus ventricosus]
MIFEGSDDDDPRPGLSSRGPAFNENYSSENLDNAVIINEINRRKNQRYNAEEVTFQARIDLEQTPPRLQATPLVAAVEAVRSLINILILRCTQNLIIQASKTERRRYCGCDNNPQRSRRRQEYRRVINIESDRLKKKSVLIIPYDEGGLCCSKAILYALAHLENDRPSINAMRHTRLPYLLKKARDLHRDAGVSLWPCSYEDIAIFE